MKHGRHLTQTAILEAEEQKSYTNCSFSVKNTPSAYSEVHSHQSLPSAVQSAVPAAPLTDTSTAQSPPGTEAAASILHPQIEPEELFSQILLQKLMQKHTAADKEGILNILATVLEFRKKMKPNPSSSTKLLRIHCQSSRSYRAAVYHRAEYRKKQVDKNR